MKLNQLADNAGSNYKSKRVGRGIGSGKGKTCARGVKGQKSRTGVAIKGFEGGQMPVYRRLPKRGFSSIARKEFQTVSIARLQAVIDAKRLDPKQPITRELLAEVALVRSGDKLVKLLGTGEFKQAVSLEIDAATASAKQKLEAAGGQLV